MGRLVLDATIRPLLALIPLAEIKNLKLKIKNLLCQMLEGTTGYLMSY